TIVARRPSPPIGLSRTGPRSSRTRSTRRSSPSASPNEPRPSFSTEGDTETANSADPPRRGGTLSLVRTAQPRGGKALRLTQRGGPGEEPHRNHRAGPWVPVISVIVGPSNLGGDSDGRIAEVARW